MIVEGKLNDEPIEFDNLQLPLLNFGEFRFLINKKVWFISSSQNFIIQYRENRILIHGYVSHFNFFDNNKVDMAILIQSILTHSYYCLTDFL